MSETACNQGELVESAKRTAFNKAHHDLGAKMLAFAGWDLPIWYTSALDEHRAVRSGTGMFDVSHMGRIRLTGKRVGNFINKIVTRPVERIPLGSGQLCLLLVEDGGILDDLWVYQIGADDYLLVWNACNFELKYDWILEWAANDSGVIINNVTEDTFMLAVQGPKASRMKTLESVSQLPRFGFMETDVGGIRVIVARTGYTGEDGYEIMGDAASALSLWQLFLEQGVVPCGLGARDSLRLEAGMMLYGQDMDRSTNPFEAGLGWLVDLDGSEFIGKSALLKIKQRGITRKLIGFQMKERGIARHGHRILKDGKDVGMVTSGGLAPSLGVNIGMGYVPVEMVNIGTELEIVIREKPVAAEIVSRRFYRNGGMK